MSFRGLWTSIRRLFATPDPPEGGKQPTTDKDPLWLQQSQREENVARRAFLLEADVTDFREMHAQYYAIAKGSLDRSKFAAETIQAASAAIAALYTGILAFVFSTTGDPLPLRGIMAPIFLGLAVVLSSIYLTYIVSPPRVKRLELKDRVAVLEQKSQARLESFIQSTSVIVNYQIRFLGMSLAALFVGLSSIALPFLGVPGASGSDNEETTVTAVASTPWPTLDAAGAALPTALAVELYKQQLAEVAAVREGETVQPSPKEPAWYFGLLAFIGVVITAAGATLPLKMKQTPDAVPDKKQDEKQAEEPSA